MTTPEKNDNKTGTAGRTPRTAPKLDRLLSASADLMARQGYSETSIRNVASETGLSLGGMYYYFENKEDLLFKIQERTFGTLLEAQRESLAGGGDAVERLRRLIHNHLDYFTSHFAELKVCTYELESLQGERYEVIADLRRRYYACLAGVVGEILGLDPDAAVTDDQVRHYTLYIFGMLNWIFMWFDPERDADITALGEEMITLVTSGLRG